jgi:acyl dehydratase
VPIDVGTAVGAVLPDRSFTWTASDVLLYHLALGAGSRTGDPTDPRALGYTLHDSRLQVLPSFGIVAHLRARRGWMARRPRTLHQGVTAGAGAGRRLVVHHLTPAGLALRQCGDRNPLHADPAFAKAAGFPAPILHGLCSYGIVLRTVVDAMLDGDTARMGRLRPVRGVVFPGETIRVRAWDEHATVVVSATVASADTDRDGAPVLADCVLTRA